MPDNRDHRTDEPATRCTEPVHDRDGISVRGCGNLLPCMDHPAKCAEPREAVGPFASLSCGSELPCARHSVEQGEQNGEAWRVCSRCEKTAVPPFFASEICTDCCAVPPPDDARNDEPPEFRAQYMNEPVHPFSDALQRERDEYRDALTLIANATARIGYDAARIARPVLAKWSRKDGGDGDAQHSDTSPTRSGD